MIKCHDLKVLEIISLGEFLEECILFQGKKYSFL